MLTQQLPAYPYEEYADDANISAFFDAYSGTNGAGTDLNPQYTISIVSPVAGTSNALAVTLEKIPLPVGETMLVQVTATTNPNYSSDGVVPALIISDFEFIYPLPAATSGFGGVDIFYTFLPEQPNAQGYLDQINALNLPIYSSLSGALLDWVGENLYGQARQNLPQSLPFEIGPINTWIIDSILINGSRLVTPSGVVLVSDAAYIAILMWNNYKGDGFQFTLRWLKRRVARFLACYAAPFVDGAGPFLVSGVATPNPPHTYQISVAFTGATEITITIFAGLYPKTLAPVLAAAIQNRTLELPFQYTFVVSY
jgi:hypothetical protein